MAARPLQGPTVTAIAFGAGALVSYLTLGAIGWAFGAMLSDSMGWSDEGWGSVLWLLLGAFGLALSRRSPNALMFWGAWASSAIALVGLNATSLAVALLAVALPFHVALRPVAPAVRLVAGVFAVFAVMVAAAVATERLGPYGTVAGLGWALLSAAYFTLWASRESSGPATALAWILAFVWTALCLGVASADAVRFQDTQAWVALGVMAFAGLLLGGLAWRSRRGSRRGPAVPVPGAVPGHTGSMRTVP